MKAWGWFVIGGVAAVGLAGLLAGCGATRAGYETARHQVVSRKGAFEVRAYPETRLVQTLMPAGEDSGFMRLFRFISGGNERGEKIAMTTPVLMERGVHAGQDSMAFVLPGNLDQAPSPTASGVSLGTIPAGRFAVHPFSAGRANPGVEADAERRLRGWMESEGMTPEGRPLFAYFDPPWIPRWFRRNEVMLRVQGGAGLP